MDDAKLSQSPDVTGDIALSEHDVDSPGPDNHKWKFQPRLFISGG